MGRVIGYARRSMGVGARWLLPWRAEGCGDTWACLPGRAGSSGLGACWRLPWNQNSRTGIRRNQPACIRHLGMALSLLACFSPIRLTALPLACLAADGSDGEPDD